MRLRSLLSLAILIAAPRLAYAQDPDIIRGRVTGDSSLALENAMITVSTIQGDMVKTARTDRNGNFTVTFIDPQGDYWVQVQSIGFQQRRFEVKRLADEDVLVADVRLSHTVQQLAVMRVQGNRPRASRNDGMGDIAGMDRGISVNGADIGSMSDLSALAGNLPGVTYLPSANGGPAG